MCLAREQAATVLLMNIARILPFEVCHIYVVCMCAFCNLLLTYDHGVDIGTNVCCIHVVCIFISCICAA